MTAINKNKVSAAFDRAANQYDERAQFQHEVCTHLRSFLPNDFTPTRLLDAGCGTGLGTELLAAHYNTTDIIGCDLSPEMVKISEARGMTAVSGDIENLPFEAHYFDLVWSNLALQWCQPPQAYAELYRVLSPNGQMVFSTLLPGTLFELDIAFSGIDEHRHVISFPSDDEVKTHLFEAGFTNISLTKETWRTKHDDFRSLLSTISGVGAGHSGDEQRRSLMGKAAWQKVKAQYDVFRDAQGKLPTTYELLFVQASKPTE